MFPLTSYLFNDVPIRKFFADADFTTFVILKVSIVNILITIAVFMLLISQELITQMSELMNELTTELGNVEEIVAFI